MKCQHNFSRKRFTHEMISQYVHYDLYCCPETIFIFSNSDINIDPTDYKWNLLFLISYVYVTMNCNVSILTETISGNKFSLCSKTAISVSHPI